MFWEYELTAPALCLGERMKKGTYRASLERTIPYSQQKFPDCQLAA
jgi:hypothetical protein